MTLSRLVNRFHISMVSRVETTFNKELASSLCFFHFRGSIVCKRLTQRISDTGQTDNIASPQKCFLERMSLKEHSSITGEKRLNQLVEELRLAVYAWTRVWQRGLRSKKVCCESFTQYFNECKGTCTAL